MKVALKKPGVEYFILQLYFDVELTCKYKMFKTNCRQPFTLILLVLTVVINLRIDWTNCNGNKNQSRLPNLQFLFFSRICKEYYSKSIHFERVLFKFKKIVRDAYNFFFYIIALQIVCTMR